VCSAAPRAPPATAEIKVLSPKVAVVRDSHKLFWVWRENLNKKNPAYHLFTAFLALNLSFKFSRQTQKKLLGISYYGHFNMEVNFQKMFSNLGLAMLNLHWGYWNINFLKRHFWNCQMDQIGENDAAGEQFYEKDANLPTSFCFVCRPSIPLDQKSQR
jgi:hypothetical protein